MKAHRLPRRLVRRLSDAQHRALDELRFGNPHAARRGELKTVLGWKRTREETRAYAEALMRSEMVLAAVAARLDVDKHYLSRLMRKGQPAADSTPRKPFADAGSNATNLQTPTGMSSRGGLAAPATGFRSFADLDAWLEERGG